MKDAGTPGPIRILLSALFRGTLTSLVISTIVNIALASGTTRPANAGWLMAGLFITLSLVFSALFHFWIITRYRGQIRMQLKDASLGQGSPICLRCGHDLTGIRGEQCPECGSNNG